MRSSLVLTAFTFVSVALWGCGADSSSTGTDQTSAAIAAGGTDSATAAFDPTACLTTYVTCVRDATSTTCKEDLRTCTRPPRPEGDKGGKGDEHGDCDGGPKGDRPPPPDGKGPPPDGDGPDGKGPPPDGKGPPPDGKGPKACVDALDTCAAGTDAADVCVTAAKACFDALPPPPRHGGHGEKKGGGPS